MQPRRRSGGSFARTLAGHRNEILRLDEGGVARRRTRLAPPLARPRRTHRHCAHPLERLLGREASARRCGSRNLGESEGSQTESCMESPPQRVVTHSFVAPSVMRDSPSSVTSRRPEVVACRDDEPVPVQRARVSAGDGTRTRDLRRDSPRRGSWRLTTSHDEKRRDSRGCEGSGDPARMVARVARTASAACSARDWHTRRRKRECARRARDGLIGLERRVAALIESHHRSLSRSATPLRLSVREVHAVASELPGSRQEAPAVSRFARGDPLRRVAAGPLTLIARRPRRNVYTRASSASASRSTVRSPLESAWIRSRTSASPP